MFRALKDPKGPNVLNVLVAQTNDPLGSWAHKALRTFEGPCLISYCRLLVHRGVTTARLHRHLALCYNTIY